MDIQVQLFLKSDLEAQLLSIIISHKKYASLHLFRLMDVFHFLNLILDERELSFNLAALLFFRNPILCCRERERETRLLSL